jgi:hypothetical protein
MTLDELHVNIRGALKKGTSLDAIFPSRDKAAARWLERNYTFQYMRRIGTVYVDLASEFPWVIEAPHNWKTVELVRIVASDGSLWTLNKDINYANQLQWETGRPTGYTLDGNERLILNCNPAEAYQLEIFWTAYTSWPTTGASTNWLLENGADFLEYQTLLYMALWLQDQRMAATYAQARDEALKTLLLEDEARVMENTNQSMQYTPEGGFSWPSDYPSSVVSS